jgi:hypothetical protein
VRIPILVSALLLVPACGSPPPASNAGAQSKPDAAACVRLVERANEDVTGSFSSDQKCKKDADCVEVELITSCTGGCDVKAVNKANLPDIEKAKQRAEQGACSEFKAMGCESPTPPPCAPPGPPRCVSGACTLDGETPPTG